VAFAQPMPSSAATVNRDVHSVPSMAPKTDADSTAARTSRGWRLLCGPRRPTPQWPTASSSVQTEGGMCLSYCRKRHFAYGYCQGALATTVRQAASCAASRQKGLAYRSRLQGQLCRRTHTKVMAELPCRPLERFEECITGMGSEATLAGDSRAVGSWHATTWKPCQRPDRCGGELLKLYRPELLATSAPESREVKVEGPPNTNWSVY
jgi:hypothetical protein